MIIFFVCFHNDQYIKKTNNIWNGENQLLLGAVSPHKVVSAQKISWQLVYILTLAGIDTSIFTGHSARAASTSKAKAPRVPTKEILKRGTGQKTQPFKYIILRR